MEHHQFTIGEVIAALEKADPAVRVKYGFGYLVPTEVDSWRGIYAEAALGHVDIGRGRIAKPITVADLLLNLQAAAKGAPFEGWKGGTYFYGPDTPLHIDNEGECSYTEIDRIEVTQYEVVIHTINAQEHP